MASKALCTGTIGSAAKRLLERPFNEVLASGEPDFPFALAWANETWKGFAHGLTNRNTLIEQRLFGRARLH
ncbi:MAG: glycoside hydrolase family 99-like domain-containing protein [Alistipes ihumii]